MSSSVFHLVRQALSRSLFVNRDRIIATTALDESRIRDAVMAGVAQAGVPLHPAEIVYFEGDSPRYKLYQRCGHVLAQRVASGVEFPESQDDSP